MPLRKSRPLLIAALAASSLAATIPATASAAPPSLSQNLTCEGKAVSSPFAAWGDFASYWLAPGGDFETGAKDWALTNAKVVAGNETLGVKTGSNSLQLGGKGLLTTSSATTAPFCVDPTHPQFRFVVKNNSPSALLSTTINFTAASGAKLSVVAKLNSYSFGKWTVSASQPLSTQIPSVFLGTGTTATVTFRVITVTAGGSVNVDNVMIDPYRRG